MSYAEYVWPAYGVSVLFLGFAIWRTLHAYGRAKRVLKALERP